MAKKKEDEKKSKGPAVPLGLKAFLGFAKGKYKLEEKEKIRKFIKTSSFKFDRILGGGFLRGRIYELFGPEGGGKTTVALDAVANAQKQYPKESTLFIDKEHGLDDLRMTNLGVDITKCIYDLDPKSGDETLQMMCDGIASKAFSIMVLDSIAILEPEEEKGIDIKESKNKMGLQGKMMSAAMRKMVQLAYDNDVCVIFINQLRDKLVMYGPKEETPGGRAVKFAASVRVNVHPVPGVENKYMQDGEQIGHKIEMIPIKNRLAPPMRKAQIDLYYSSPLDTVGEVIALGLEFDIITLKGRTYYFGEQKLASSSALLRTLLVSNYEIRRTITAEVEKVIDTVIHKERTAEKIDLDKAGVSAEEIPDNLMEEAGKDQDL